MVAREYRRCATSASAAGSSRAPSPHSLGMTIWIRPLLPAAVIAAGWTSCTRGEGPLVALVGDSLTSGYRPREEEAYPALVATARLPGARGARAARGRPLPRARSPSCRASHVAGWSRAVRPERSRRTRPGRANRCAAGGRRSSSRHRSPAWPPGSQRAPRCRRGPRPSQRTRRTPAWTRSSGRPHRSPERSASPPQRPGGRSRSAPPGPRGEAGER